MKDPVTRAVADTKDDLAAVITKAHLDAARNVSLRELDAALSSGNTVYIRKALGITPDGLDWPYLREALHDALQSVLAPIFDAVSLDTIKALGGDYGDSQSERDQQDDAYNAALAAMLTQVLIETLDGVNHAIALTLKSNRFTSADLIAAIGLTMPQVTLFYGVNQAAAKLRAKLDKANNAKSRADIAQAYLATLPTMIAAQLRKKLQQSDGTFGDREARTLAKTFSDTLRNHRIKPLAEFNAATIANIAEDLARIVAQKIGLIPANTRKYWRTMHDERVRHTHSQIEAMNANGIPLDAAFDTPFGFQVRYAPVERNCRCRVTLD